MKRTIPGLQELLAFFLEKGIETCILYGSAVTERFRDSSDIDLAVSGDHVLSKEILVEFYLKAADLLKREVDIKDLRTARGILLKEILTRGEILINTDPEFLGRKSIEMMDFQTDMAPGINIMLKKRMENLVHGK